MMKYHEMRKADSCLNRAGIDEPIFVLRAKDEVAAAAVRHWATMAFGIHEPKKIQEALDLAGEMDRWRGQNVQQVADTKQTNQQ